MPKREAEPRPAFHEYIPHPSVIEVLKGTISDPITTKSYKPGPTEGKMVTVRLVTEGAGLSGLTDWKDNKEWAGITNHVLLSARDSVYFAQRMAEAGFNTNPQRVLDGMLVSHAGRREWDEAGWYPKAVTQAEAKRKISNETLGLRLIQGKVPQNAFDLVFALGHGDKEEFSADPSIYDSLDFRIAIYVDHRTTQQYEPLNRRMGDFLLNNFFKKDEITSVLKDRVYASIGDIIDRQKRFRLGEEGIKAVSLDEADKVAESLGAGKGSERLPREDLMQLILNDADTEALLIQEGIDVDNINDQTVPVPAWEHEFRMQYVRAAEAGIIGRLNELFEEMRQKHAKGEDISKTKSILADEFPVNTWWGQYARKLWTMRKGEQAI